jgi:hypothetical protein
MRSGLLLQLRVRGPVLQEVLRRLQRARQSRRPKPRQPDVSGRRRATCKDHLPPGNLYILGGHCLFVK